MHNKVRLRTWVGRHAIVLVAICALAATVALQIHNWNLDQERERLQRLHDQLSATPAVQLLASPMPTEWAPRIGLFLLNHGGGPAVMQELKTFVDDKPLGLREIAESLEEQINTTSEDEEDKWIGIAFASSGWEVLPPRAEMMLLEFPSWAWTTERGKILRGFFARMTIDVTYESIYGEAFAKSFTPYQSVDSAETSE